MIPIPHVAPATLSLCALVPAEQPRDEGAQRQRMRKHRVLSGEISRALARREVDQFLGAVDLIEKRSHMAATTIAPAPASRQLPNRP
jgi:hypothetical protein